MDVSDRYSRQILFTPLGEKGQRRLMASRVVLVGCGALGSVSANILVRAGVGHVRIVDRDVIQWHNLHRQMLFDEDDVRGDLPKAEAAARKLRRINSGVVVEPIVADANPDTIEELTEDAEVIVDATDNFETRFLINDVAVKTARPWIYGACVGSTGMALPILPGRSPCLRCVVSEIPPPELNPTCETAGILGPVVATVAAHQAMEAIKILAGCVEAVDGRLLSFDAWSGRHIMVNVQNAFEQGDCPCCKEGRYEYLQGSAAGRTITLCGRDAVQVYPGRQAAVDLAALAERLEPVASERPRFNPLLLKAHVESYELTVFADGRAIIKGTSRPQEARAVYARYLGG